MSQFLVRGWNVAIPEVDVGDDIFVVQDDSDTLRRVQVKSSSATGRTKSFSGQFNIQLLQLKNISKILIHYVFVVRHLNTWTDPVIIRQDYLLDHFQEDKIGSSTGNRLNLYFSYSANTVKCSGLNLNKYLNDFSDFPIIS